MMQWVAYLWIAVILVLTVQAWRRKGFPWALAWLFVGAVVLAIGYTVAAIVEWVV